MSEFTQVDLQIGTEEQFETKKADLPEGTIVGLTDLIHESELDEALQTKINTTTKTYLHEILLQANVESHSGPPITYKMNLTSTSQAPYDYGTMQDGKWFGDVDIRLFGYAYGDIYSDAGKVKIMCAPFECMIYYAGEYYCAVNSDIEGVGFEHSLVTSLSDTVTEL